jgi:type II secretory pathway component PulJ
MHCMRKPCPNKGQSLVEYLLATALLSLSVLAAYAHWAESLRKAWKLLSLIYMLPIP